MGTVYKIVNDRTVIDRKEGQDISQEPEMKELGELHETMTKEEQNRTARYLRESPENKKEV
jgi:hypothetical protein